MQFPLTDLGNAQRLVAYHRDAFRYAGKKWLVWDGAHWSEDRTNEIMRAAKETVKKIPEEKWAKRSEDRTRLNAMIELASSEPPFAVAPEEFDRKPHLLNLRNGTYNLRTHELQPHNPNDLLTKIANVEYNPHAEGNLWSGFLNTSFDEDEEMISYVQRAVGYSLIGGTDEQCMFILFGSGRNGKSTFLDVVASVLGDYAIHTDSSSLLTKTYDRIPSDIARLQGARFVTATEVRAGRALDESLIKQLTGGDKVSARFLHREWFDFHPECTIFMAVNHLPDIRSRDLGIWRRIRVVPFTVQIPEKRIDKHLKESLLAEKEGILLWALEGLWNYQKAGLQEPDQVSRMTSDYQRETDILGEFFEERCLLAENATSSKDELYREYEYWNGIGHRETLSKRAFGKALKERGFKEARATGGERKWAGITKKADAGADVGTG